VVWLAMVKLHRARPVTSSCVPAAVLNAFSAEIKPHGFGNLLYTRKLSKFVDAPVFMHVILNHEGSSMSNGHFSHNRSNSRYSHDLALPKVISGLSRRSVCNWGAKLWNSIPLAIRCAQCLGSSRHYTGHTWKAK
jgi:hypothetical protein